jgi:hypothetical protein
MTTLLLMGAGASYGSEPRGAPAPPLGEKLFLDLESAGGVAATMPDSLKKEFRNNFENGMLRYKEWSDAEERKPGTGSPSIGNSQQSVMQFQRELARYLAEFRPTADSVYLKLIEALGADRLIYSSLNYDLLFEQSASRFCYEMHYGETTDHLPRGPRYVRLLKPHGSSNFWPSNARQYRGIFSAGNGLGDYEGPITPRNREETLQLCGLNAFSPSMSMYAVGKPANVSPRYVLEQQRLWKNEVERVRHIFIVGTRVHSADKHIWEPLASCPARITFFGFSDDDQKEFEEWRNEYSVQDAHFDRACFDESVAKMKALLD